MALYWIYIVSLQKIIDEKKVHEAEFYNKLFRTDNMLNKQLKMSEDGKCDTASPTVSSLTSAYCCMIFAHFKMELNIVRHIEHCATFSSV